MFNVWVDYPKDDELKEIVRITTSRGFEEPEPVLDGAGVLRLRELVLKVPISEHVLDYITRLTIATRPDRDDTPEVSRKYLDWGAGPRAGQYLSLGAKSRALLRGNLQATVEDVKAVAHSVLRHRVVTNFTAIADGVDVNEVIRRLIEAVPESA